MTWIVGAQRGYAIPASSIVELVVALHQHGTDDTRRHELRASLSADRPGPYRVLAVFTDDADGLDEAFAARDALLIMLATSDNDVLQYVDGEWHYMVGADDEPLPD